MGFTIRDRLYSMRFHGCDLGVPTPDGNTIRHVRNRLTETGRLKRVMKAVDRKLQKKGDIPMPGRIIDASLLPAPKQCNTEAEKAAIRAGRSAGGDPARRAEQGGPEGHRCALDAEDWRQAALSGRRDAAPDERDAGVRLQVAHFDRPAHRLHPRERRHIGRCRRRAGTDAPDRPGELRLRGPGRQRLSLPEERKVAGLASAHQPHSPPPSRRASRCQGTARANAKKSSGRTTVEHVFAHQKARFGLFIRTIGLARAEANLTLAGIAYNGTG